MDAAVYAAFIVLNRKLNKILELLGEEVMPELDALEEQVGRLESVAQLAADRIKQLIEQGGSNVDPAQVQAIVDRLKSVGDKLEAASTA